MARGYAQVGLKRPEDAQKSFAEAEQVAPNAVEPLLADARLAVARADLAGARQKIDRAIAAQPKSAEALLAKAQLLRLKNEFSGAIAVLDELITDQPSVMQARLDRASLELSAGKNDAAKADIDAVLKGTPGNVQAIYLQAVMEAQSRNYKAADADLERISGYIGRIQRAFYLQAVVKEQLGQFEQAEEAARKYLGRAPNDLAAYKVLARIQFAKHRPDQVIETLAKVAESGKADAEAYDLLGRAYAATGRGAEAIQSFQKAETMAPNDVGRADPAGLGPHGDGRPRHRHGRPGAHAGTGAQTARGQRGAVLRGAGNRRHQQGGRRARQNPRGPGPDRDRRQPGRAVQAGADRFRRREGDVHRPGAEIPRLSRPAKINLARVDIMLGDRAAADQILTDVLAKQPTAEPALTMMVSGYVQANRLADAAAVLERAHRAEPNQTRITVTLGDVYIRSGMAAEGTGSGGSRKRGRTQVRPTS